MKNVTDLYERLACETRPLLIYGMGNGADKLLRILEAKNLTCADFFASDGFVRGHSFHGKRVLSYAEAREKHGDFLTLVSFATRQRDVLDRLYGMADGGSLFLPDMPVSGDTLFDSAFASAHEGELTLARELLADEESRGLFDAIVRYKITGDIRYLRSHHHTVDDMYALMPCSSVECCMDLGAYRGDTLSEMARYFPNMKHAIALEPDRKNHARLLRYAESETRFTIDAVCAAAFSRQGSAVFHTSGNRNASLDGASYQHTDDGVLLLPPDLAAKGRRIDYIKYDVEGAEREALLGSVRILSEDRPTVLLSVYHRSEDLYELPLLLKSLCHGYRFYLRRTECLPAWETALIAVPYDSCTDERN